MTSIKALFAVVLSLSLSFLAAQNFQGIAIYHTATSFDMKMDSSQVNPERQKRIQEMMSKAMQKEFELKFDKTTSTYSEVETLEEGGPGGRGRGMRIMSSFFGGGGSFYKNTSSKELLEQTELFGKKFLIKDSLTDWNWQLGKETKQIGAYTCYKATATREVTRTTFSRKGDEDKEEKVTTEETVVAWWTPQIPISQGPNKYWGLPGLILELNDGTTTMVCSRVVLNPKEGFEIKMPDEGEEVTSEEYSEIMTKKMEEMQEMYGGRRQRGGRGGGGSFSIEIRN